MTTRLLVIGSEGQVARSLKEATARASGLDCTFLGRPEIDLSRPDTVTQAVRRAAPDIVINPAAYTAVDRAEAEPDLAFAINRDGAAAVAAAAHDVGAAIVHFSTDYVYGGDKRGAYVETDPVAPQGVYGHSKLAGEVAVARANPKHVILRTAWIYSPFGSNFVLTMLRLASERDLLRVVDDQEGCPSYAPDLAAAVVALAGRIAGSGWSADFAGVTHIAGPQAMTWHQFSRAIVQGSAIRGGPSAAVEPISTADYPTPARRPANSCLDTGRLGSVFGISLPTFETSLGQCLDRLIGPRENLRAS